MHVALHGRIMMPDASQTPLVNSTVKRASMTCSGVVILYTGDELDALFEGAEQGDSEQGGKDGGFSGPKAVLSSFARFMGSLSK